MVGLNLYDAVKEICDRLAKEDVDSLSLLANNDSFCLNYESRLNEMRFRENERTRILHECIHKDINNRNHAQTPEEETT